ncbi:MAG: cupredoxin domain-containing protein [Thaumarchaeota archaeon]|nr:cupredoxin domain-containing protein [Nitrososphaerota archaeon]
MATSSAFALVVVGFIIGALVIGALAGATEARLLGGATGDVSIVSGASSPSNPQFYSPSPFTVAAGHEVTWVNRDGTTHTVTSNATGLFDSSNMLPGATWSHTFSTAGTYQYYCSLHPFMKGTVVVTP